jgi:N-acetyl-anhydromuramyl-L-alanine amidase AmpD
MVQGAHCVGQNNQAIGIENDGIYLDVQPPQALWNSLITFCAFTCQQYQIPPTEIYGHKDFNSTQCPGLLHGRLPELRASVAARLG